MNRPLPLEARLVQRLAAAFVPLRPTFEVPERAGAVKDSVLRVLAEAEGPMRAREIHLAAEAHAGTCLSWNTVKDCLHKQARRDPGLVRRVGHGMYVAG